MYHATIHCYSIFIFLSSDDSMQNITAMEILQSDENDTSTIGSENDASTSIGGQKYLKEGNSMSKLKTDKTTIVEKVDFCRIALKNHQKGIIGFNVDSFS